jgi:hypothetical protein
MEDYGIHHRISSVANPHTNARAELGVKTVNRMLMIIMSTKGILDRGVVSRALLQLRNTQDRDSQLTPAKAHYEREFSDFLPRLVSALMWDMWMNLMDARETAQARRAKHSEKKWSEHMMTMAPLEVGDTVMVQNQSGNDPLRWDNRETVMKCEGFDQYQVMIDGSRRLTEQKKQKVPETVHSFPP